MSATEKSLLARLKAGASNTVRVPFPGKEEQEVVLRVLTVAQVQQAELAAEDLFKKKGLQYTTSSGPIWEMECSVQTLAMAMRDPEDTGKPVARDAEELRMLLSEQEVSFLKAQYEALCIDSSPEIDKVTDEELSALLDTVKKSPQETVSTVRSIKLLRRLCESLAVQCSILQREKSSG